MIVFFPSVCLETSWRCVSEKHAERTLLIVGDKITKESFLLFSESVTCLNMTEKQLCAGKDVVYSGCDGARESITSKERFNVFQKKNKSYLLIFVNF